MDPDVSARATANLGQNVTSSLDTARVLLVELVCEFISIITFCM